MNNMIKSDYYKIENNFVEKNLDISCLCNFEAFDLRQFYVLENYELHTPKWSSDYAR